MTHSQATADQPDTFPLDRRTAGCPFDPPPAARALQENGPLHRVSLADGREPWLVTRYDEGKQVLSSLSVSADASHPGYPSAHATSGGGGLSFILMDDPEHARLRRMVTAPFAIKRIEALRPVVQQITDDLIDQLLAGPNPVDLVEAFALPLPSLVICALLGVPYEDHDQFQAHSKTIIRRTTTEAERQEAFQALGAYLTSLLRRKTKEPGDDLLTDIAGRVTAGDMTEGEAVQMGILLLIAGHETTANMIALGTLALLEHPDERDRLLDNPEPALVASAVEELLRYLTITHDGRKRVATEDITVAGTTIHAGEGVIVATDLANRDPEVYPNPDRLDLTRNPRNHIAFGFGVHQCLGQPLARVELQVVYPTLFRRIPTLSRAVPLAEIPFKHDGAVYGVYELPVTWCPVNHTSTTTTATTEKVES
jgi:cytochrome P450